MWPPAWGKANMGSKELRRSPKRHFWRLFGDFIPKGRNWNQNKLYANIGKEDQERGYDLGG
jgi:hypothetical protein